MLQIPAGKRQWKAWKARELLFYFSVWILYIRSHFEKLKCSLESRNGCGHHYHGKD
jgi:hypothetical protein